MIQLYGGGVSELRVSDLTEDELIASFVPLLSQAGALVPTGDDAAVLRLADPRVAVTTDVLVENVHFSRDWSTGYDLGWRAIMQNAPDLAAMGATPSGFVVAVVLPGDLPASWPVDLARGMGDACAAVGVLTGRECGVVGGDLAAGPLVVVSVSAFGELRGDGPVLRSGACAGDVLAHAGTLGRSAAGLALLRAGITPGESAELAAAVATYLRPTPPLGAALAAAAGGARAMIDVSDGLVLDSSRLARASGVAIDLAPPLAAAAVDPVVLAAAQRLGMDPEPWILGGGEDHGFLAAFPPGTPLPAGFRAVGQVLEGGGVTVGGAVPRTTGWDHFKAKPTQPGPAATRRGT